MSNFLESLIRVSEKAANIARVIRHEQHLFSLLIQEKGTGEANPRFVQDFKTLADVLIQETVRYDLGTEFPALVENIKGEEDNLFCNKVGEKIHVEIQSDIEETANLLSKVLDGDIHAADLLAAEVHKTILIEDINCIDVKLPDFDIDISEIGIWIDPIDSTAEYINGQDLMNICDGICSSGLQCVTVLIGVYELKSGVPIIGVVNQPFYQHIDGRWRGQCYWGVSINGVNQTSFKKPNEQNKIISISSSATSSLKTKLSDSGFKCIEAPGAGYKILTVACGLADCNVVTRGFTFKWDTCAPHALLRALGGGVVSYNASVNSNKREQLVYNKRNTENLDGEKNVLDWSNSEGFIAYRDEQVLNNVISILKE